MRQKLLTFQGIFKSALVGTFQELEACHVVVVSPALSGNGEGWWSDQGTTNVLTCTQVLVDKL